MPFPDQPVAALAVRLAAKVVMHTRGLVADAADARRAAHRAVLKDETSGTDGVLGDSDRINNAVGDDGAAQKQQQGTDDLWRADPDAAAKALVDRCHEAEATSPTAWRSFLDRYAATLPTRGPALDDTDGSSEPVYSTGIALAVVQRILPVLDVHHLAVYDMRLRPEYTDHIAGPWDPVVPRPMVEIDCGTGDWLLQVAAGRVWSDDVREGQETPGGTLAVRFAVNRRTGVFVDTANAWLGDGRNAATDALFAFFRSGASQVDAYVDARYGRIYRAQAALTASREWRLAGDKDNDHGLCRPWSIVSAGRERATDFVRTSDGHRVRVTSKRGSVFVSVGNDRVSLPDAAYPTPPARDGVGYPFAVQRPPADYAAARDDVDDGGDGDKYHRHNRGDRDHLVAQGLLDPMHMVSEWMSRYMHYGVTMLSSWPYVRFDFDPDQHMDALGEADWHARLSARMHLVADLARGDCGPPVDPDALAVASASALMAHAPVFFSNPQDGAAWRVNGHTCDAVLGHLASLGAARPWRIFRQKDSLCYGNRYHDPTRGLCVNWFVECNFAQSRSDDARPTVRFYGHIVGLDAGAGPTAPREPASGSLTMVAAYYCLSARAHMPGRYDDGVWDPDRADPDDVAIASSVDAAVDAARPTATTRFAADEPHPLVAYYRERDFDLAPGHFRGILDEDAMRVDVDASGRSAAGALVLVLDWLATAFDRHATLFALRADP